MIVIIVVAGWISVHDAGPHPGAIRGSRLSVQKVYVSRTLKNLKTQIKFWDKRSRACPKFQFAAPHI